MATGYRVILGNDVLDNGDSIIVQVLEFIAGTTIGGGSVNWTAPDGAGGTISGTTTGTYQQGADGNIYFVADPASTDIPDNVTTIDALVTPSLDEREFGTNANDINVAGSAGDDVMYGGASTSATGTGDDTINGAAGEDTIFGGDGDDLLIGGGANDSIEGGTGDDVIYGDTPDARTSANETLEFVTAARPTGTDVLGGFTQNTGTVNVTVTSQDQGNLGGAEISDVTNFVDGDGRNPDSGLRLTATGTANDQDSATVNIAFDGIPELGTANEVENVVFYITDIDIGNFQDRISVTGWNEDGENVLVTIESLDPTGADTVIPQSGSVAGGDFQAATVIGNGDADTNAEAEGTIRVTIQGPVNRILIDYDNQLSNFQLINISDVTFTTITDEAGDDTIDAGAGEDVVYGGAGDDTIDGAADNDTIFGEDGDDTLQGGAGNDTIYGDDTIVTAWQYEYYDLDPAGDPQNLEDAGFTGGGTTNSNTPTDTGIATSFNPSDYDTADDFALKFTGTINVETGGVYTFTTASDDGSKLFVDGVEVVTNDGLHGTVTETGTVTLGPGPHTIEIIYFENDGGQTLSGTIAGPDTGGAALDLGTYSSVETQIMGVTSGDDIIDGGLGDDDLFGGLGDDTFVVQNTFGNDTITAGEDPGDTDTDVLDASAVTDDTTLDLRAVDATDPESGTLTDGTDTTTFTEIEAVVLGSGDDTAFGSSGADNIDLGQGADTIEGGAGDDVIDLGTDSPGVTDGDADVIVLNDGFGNDTINNIDAPTDNGDGTFTGIDTLDVTGLNNGDVVPSPVTTNDVTVTDDGAGNAVLTFPNGESITLNGIDPVDAADPQYLSALGIPLPNDGTVSGTAGSDLIDTSYVGDPEGDRVDNNDAILAGDTGNDDLIIANGGNDTVLAGDGNDEVYGGAGDDSIEGGIGDDVIESDGEIFINGALDAPNVPDGAWGITEQVEGWTSNSGSFEVWKGTRENITADDDDAYIELDQYEDSVDNITQTIDTTAGEVYTFSFDSIVRERADGEDIEVYIDGVLVDTVSPNITDWQTFTVEFIGTGAPVQIELREVAGQDNALGPMIDNLSVVGSGDDTVDGGAGDDTIITAFGDDDIVLNDGFGNDIITAGEDSDGADIDELDGSGLTEDVVLTLTDPETGTITNGTDTATFSEIEEFILGSGDDSVTGSIGDDVVDLGAGDDSINAGAGDDSIDAGQGSDTIQLENAFGTDTITGGEDTLGGDVDVLDAMGITSDIVLNLTAPETGTLTTTDGVATFDGIEEFVLGTGDDSVIGSAGDDVVDLGAGADTIEGGAGDDVIDLGTDAPGVTDGDPDVVILEDGFGDDVIANFDAPTPNGDGTFTGIDTVVVTDLFNAPSGDPDRGPVTTNDVTVTDDGSGNAVLTFPNGESITLLGVDPVDADDPFYLNAIGIPMPDGTVSGTAGDDLIDGSYIGDPDGDIVDNNDAIITGADADDDLILAFAGDDSVTAGLGEDRIDGGSGNDTIDGGAEDDQIAGGSGADSLIGGTGDDTIYGGGFDNLLVNGSFENNSSTGPSSDPDGWTFTGPGGVATVEPRATDGTNVVALGGWSDSVGAQMSQTASVETGEDYTLSFDIGTLFRSFDQVVQIEIFDETGSVLTQTLTISGGDIDSFDFTFTATSDAMTVRFTHLDGEEGDADLDNIVLVPASATADGDDTIDGGLGADVIDAGAGSDTVILNDDFGNDDITGGEDAGDTDVDMLDGSGLTQDVTVDFAGAEAGTVTNGTDTADFAEIEEIFTGSGDDTIIGGTGDDTVDTGAGDDVVTFGEGDDISGGAGDDTFTLTDTDRLTDDTITIDGGSGDETPGVGGGDILRLGTLGNLQEVLANAVDDGTGSLSGTATLDDGTILNFSEIEQIVCFTPGAMIATPHGSRAIETLGVGDLVVTRDHGLQPIRWIQSRTVPAMGRFAPVRIKPGTATGLERDLLVSPQHRMLFQGYRSELLFGESEVLVSAAHLVDHHLVSREEGGMVTYIHMMFDEHEVIYAEGAATESFHPGEIGLNGITEEAREELFALFPALRSDPTGYGQAARRCLKKHESQLLRIG